MVELTRPVSLYGDTRATLVVEGPIDEAEEDRPGHRADIGHRDLLLGQAKCHLQLGEETKVPRKRVA